MAVAFHTYNREQVLGVSLAQEVRLARRSGLRILLIHENDPERGGCEFAHFLTTTPQDLIEGGLYSSVAAPPPARS